ARSRVVTHAPARPPGLDALPDAYAPVAPEAAGELTEYLQPTPRTGADAAILAFASLLRDGGPGQPLGSLVWRLVPGLHRRFEYAPGPTEVGPAAAEASPARRGVCQDYTHVALATARCLGIPSRYVSGYFHPEGAGGDVGEQASHAWLEVWFPQSGWIGVDPANDRLVNDRYIRLAYGRDYADVTPIRGSHRGSGSSTLDVAVTVGAGRQAQQ